MTEKNYEMIEKCKELKGVFIKHIHGHHMVHKGALKEASWEEMFCNIAKQQFTISDEANGNHASGKDNKIDDTNISNKTAKIDTKDNTISISSYRLTTVCNIKNIGTSEDITEAIKQRDNSFEYVALLARIETEDSHIEYRWYMIPKDCHLFRIDNLNHKIGKRGTNQGEIVGWESEYASISFSMSSQLWYKFSIDEIKKYMVCYTEVDNSKPKISYSQIYDSFSNTI